MDKKKENNEENEDNEDEEEEEEEDDEEEKKDVMKKEENEKTEVKKEEEINEEKKEKTKENNIDDKKEGNEEEEEDKKKEEEEDKKKEEEEEKKEIEIKEKEDNKKEKIKNESKDEENIYYQPELKTEKEEPKIQNELNQEKIENNEDDLKSNKATLPPTKTKFHLTKSSSASNINLNKDISKDNLNTLNAKEIRFKDLFETSKRYFQKQFNLKNQKGCFKCGNKDIPTDNYIEFSCGHKSCQECLIKDLLLLQFKNLENKEKIQFKCICLVGTSPQYQFLEFLETIKKINELKQQKHQCKKHQNVALKYCKNCELWLCDECLTIHDVFNNNHILSEKDVRLKLKCKIHNDEFTQFYCLQCNEEVCPFCLTKIGKHSEHKTIKFEKLEKLGEEIIFKLKFKSYEDCVKNLDNILEKNISEKNKKIENFQIQIDNLIEKIKLISENYIKKINEKIEYLNQVIEVMKETYKYFYIMLAKEKKEFDEIKFLREISEINNIKSFYSNYEDISYANKFIDKFGINNNVYYSYEIKIDNTPFQYSSNFEKIFFKKFKINKSINENKKEISIISKYHLPKINFQEIKYDKNINTKKGNIYSMCKTNKDEIVVACGEEIYIVSNLNSEIYNSIDKYPSLNSQTKNSKSSNSPKNIICMTLIPENKLASGGEDRIIRIWDLTKRKLIFTISNNYKRIDSLLPYKNNCLIVGAYNIIKIINIDTKKELVSLMGHEKSICCIIELYPNILATSSYDNTIKVWDLKYNVCEYTLYGHDCPVFCILLLRDGRLISGSGSKNKSLKIWNLEKKSCEFSLIGHKREVRDIKQLRNGLVVTASMDKTIKIWNISKRICIQTLMSHNDVLFSLCIIDKNRFASGGRDQDIIIWKY